MFSGKVARSDTTRPGVVALPAFTLTETIIVLAISGLLLTIIYASIRAVEHRYHLFIADSDKQLQISGLYYMLERDFQRAQWVRKDDNRIRVDNDSIMITYQLLDSLIVRRQECICPTLVSQPVVLEDTFRLKVQAPVFGWQGKSIHPAGFLDTFSFEGIFNQEPYYFHLTKFYDQQTLWLIEKKSY